MMTFPDRLTGEIEAYLDVELEPFPHSIKSVFGQTLQIIDGEDWSKEIIIEIIGYTAFKICWSEKLHPTPYLDWIIRSWVVDRLRAYVDFRPLLDVKATLQEITITECSAEQFEQLIYEQLRRASMGALTSGKYDLITAYRQFYRWCLAEDLPGFSEYHDLELGQISPPSNDNRFLVTMRDLQQGPFTRGQLNLIESALSLNTSVSTAQKAMFYLCRDWGLRPVQIALLNTEDIESDRGGPFVMVPSVKGKIRSKLRRHPTNMKKRYINDDTFAALKLQSEEAEKIMATSLARANQISEDHALPKITLCTPLFPSPLRSTARVLRFLKSPKIAPYAFHSDSCKISHQIKSLTWKLGIETSRHPLDSSKYMDISAYRFRRSVGSSMVLAGATPEEVAEALDHQSVHSIAHYFRYNLELQAYINKVHLDSPQIRSAVSMWQGRFEEDTSQPSGFNSVAKLGKCSRKSACPYHPTVTCYACQHFKPSKNADHKAALEEIKLFQSMLNTSSTGAMAQQVEAALYGAEAILIALKETK